MPKKIKRVLHFQGRMGRGGAESFMMNAFNKIDRTKYIFDFVIYEDYKDITPYHNEIKELGGNIYVVPNPNKNILSYIKCVRKILKNKQVDIVHNQIFFGGGLNLWLAKKAGIKQRIAHSHATTDGKGNKLPYSLVRTLFNKLLLSNATDFLACSNEAGLGLYGDKQDFRVIPNGINIQKYAIIPESKNEIKKSLNIPESSFVVGHIGRFEEQKNHVFLLDIFKKILTKQPNAYLILIGKGSLEESIRKNAIELGIIDNVLFLGERSDVPRILKSMDVFVMPSLYEGLPMVAVEAQAANLKLVLSSEISKDTTLSKNVCYIPLNETTEVWAEKILGEPKINKPLAKLFEFDNERTAKMLESIYNKSGE